MRCFGGSKPLVHVVLGAALLCSACASSAISAVPGGTPTVPASSPTRPADAPMDKKVARPADPLAPVSYEPVLRKGRKPHPTLQAKAGGFAKSAPVQYSDGVSLTVNHIAHGVEKAKGPGQFPGRPTTAISMTVHNRSTQALDLNAVVVTTMYGSPARIAAPVYGDSSGSDFSGKLAAGGSASAMYVFAIPSGRGGRVVTMVDFDDVHLAARFTGSTD